jgi:hypothetical protein
MFELGHIGHASSFSASRRRAPCGAAPPPIVRGLALRLLDICGIHAILLSPISKFYSTLPKPCLFLLPPETQSPPTMSPFCFQAARRRNITIFRRS